MVFLGGPAAPSELGRIIEGECFEVFLVEPLQPEELLWAQLCDQLGDGGRVWSGGRPSRRTVRADHRTAQVVTDPPLTALEVEGEGGGSVRDSRPTSQGMCTV